MKRVPRQLMTGLATAGLVLAMAAAAMAGGHYPPGVEGVEAATIPPPGFHYRMYNLFYSADTLRDKNGNSQNIGFDLKVFANTHRFVYMTPYKLWGADYGFDVVIPLVDTDFKIGAMGLKDQKFGLGDILVEPIILAWHLPRWDIGFALGAYMPTGQSGEPASPGLGYWSLMGTLGATYFLDDQKTWSASVLTRWLKNFEDRDNNITPGAELVAEWGLGKTIPAAKDFLVRPGLAGYCYWQLGDDSGTGADKDARSRAYAIGPEINLFWLPPWLVQLNFRYLYEFSTQDEPEGHKFILTFTKSF